jgi:hypothetical protein
MSNSTRQVLRRSLLKSVVSDIIRLTMTLVYHSPQRMATLSEISAKQCSIVAAVYDRRVFGQIPTCRRS